MQRRRRAKTTVKSLLEDLKEKNLVCVCERRERVCVCVCESECVCVNECVSERNTFK